MATKTVVQDHQSVAKAAMERRLADAKAKLLQQQQQQQLQKNEIKSDSLPTPSKTSTTKDHKEENFVAYARLSGPVDENLLASNVKLSSTKGTIVKKLLDNLYRSGDCSQKYLQGSKKADLEKQKEFVHLDNLVQLRSGSKKASLCKNSKRSKSRMSMKRLKKSGALQLPQDRQKFDLFKPMHGMWESYMMQLIKATGGKAHLASTILSADLHGAFMFVAECKVESFTGLQGIMVRETSETFGIITRDDKFRVVPKKLSVFIVQLECWKFTLLGDKFTSRDNVLQR